MNYAYKVSIEDHANKKKNSSLFDPQYVPST